MKTFLGPLLKQLSSLKNHLEKIPIFLKGPRGPIAGLVLVGLALLLASVFDGKNYFHKTPSQKEDSQSESWSTDTVIPKGYSLVPIEIENRESLANLMGPYGVVELFTSSRIQGRKGVRVASQIKMIRAPNNPNQYAVLVPAARASEILAFPGPFVVALQNPNTLAESQFKSPKKLQPRIEYFSSKKDL